jgi:small subunit ribosomal protein S15
VHHKRSFTSLSQPRRFPYHLGFNRVRLNKHYMNLALKTHCPKSDWQIKAEREFLEERAQVPEGYTNNFTQDDVRNMAPELQKLLTLDAASEGRE